jgi:hypothetical protein
MFMQMDKAKSHRGCQFKVWEEPHPQGVYVIGADPAYGHDEGNDRSALQVLRCYADQVEQVAEFAHSEIPTNMFAWIIASILGGYSASPQSSARLILEINGPGEAVWNEYKTLKQQILTGYLRVQAQEAGLGNIFTNVRQYIHTRADSMTAGSVYHWKTSPMNKVGLLERCRDFVETGACIIHSQELLSEMKSIARKGDTIEAEGNKKDDRVFALALACRAWEQFERKNLIASHKTRAFEDAKNRVSIRDQMQIFNTYRIKEFMDRKEKARNAAARAAAAMKWRGR